MVEGAAQATLAPKNTRPRTHAQEHAPKRSRLVGGRVEGVRECPAERSLFQRSLFRLIGSEGAMATASARLTAHAEP
jgi:hypothetical protein